MAKAKAFKASGWLGKQMAAEKAKANRWYLLKAAKGEPAPVISGIPYGRTREKLVAKMKDLIAYAAALGRKQGSLPDDMSTWSAWATWSGDTGVVRFRQSSRAS